MCKAVSIWLVNALFVYKLFCQMTTKQIGLTGEELKKKLTGGEKNRMQSRIFIKSVCVHMRIKKIQ